MLYGCAVIISPEPLQHAALCRAGKGSDFMAVAAPRMGYRFAESRMDRWRAPIHTPDIPCDIGAPAS